jgi:hypothetical protein
MEYKGISPESYCCRLILGPVPSLCSQIYSPWMGDIVDSGTGLSYRPASLFSLAWRAGTTTICRSQLYSPNQGLWIWLLDKERCNCYCTEIKGTGRESKPSELHRHNSWGGGGEGGAVDPDYTTAKTEAFFTSTDSMRAAYCFIMTSSRLQ